MKRLVLLLFLLLSIVATGAAAEPGALTPLPAPSVGVSLVRMLGSLLFVVAIFFAGAWLFRNLHRFRGQAGPQRKLQILEARSLGVRQSIYVVGFEQQRMLIGATPQGLTLLTHLPDGTPEPEGGRVIPVPFGEALLQALGRK